MPVAQRDGRGRCGAVLEKGGYALKMNASGDLKAMPIYEYECRECGHRLDALQKIADDPLVDCPACSAASLKRLISAPQFRLKGGGWYETDFKTGNKRNLVDGKEPVKDGSSKKEPGKKDAADKPAKKASKKSGDTGGTAAA